MFTKRALPVEVVESVAETTATENVVRIAFGRALVAAALKGREFGHYRYTFGYGVIEAIDASDRALREVWGIAPNGARLG